jgi:hypothetical protein
LKAGFFAYVTAHITLGLIDLAGKIAGVGDVLEPIRTASFSYLTTVEEAGFWRIVGGYSEASTFGAASLLCIAFTFTYWRYTRSLTALIMSALLLILLLLSTSSTAYVGLALLGVPVGFAILFSLARDRLTAQDFLLIGLAFVGVVGVLAIFLFNEKAMAPFIELFEQMVLNKASSDSAKERFYWNSVSLMSFFDTYGLGIGMGSSRSSSWLVSIISQLGLIGSLMLAALIHVLLGAFGGPRLPEPYREIQALSAAIAAAGLAWLLANSISGGSADPGLLFFVSVASVLVCKQHLRAAQPRRSTRTAPEIDRTQIYWRPVAK